MEADWANIQAPTEIAEYIKAAKTMEATDEKLRKRIIFGVAYVWKRLAAPRLLAQGWRGRPCLDPIPQGE